MQVDYLLSYYYYPGASDRYLRVVRNRLPLKYLCRQSLSSQNLFPTNDPDSNNNTVSQT